MHSAHARHLVFLSSEAVALETKNRGVDGDFGVSGVVLRPLPADELAGDIAPYIIRQLWCIPQFTLLP